MNGKYRGHSFPAWELIGTALFDYVVEHYKKLQLLAEEVHRSKAFLGRKVGRPASNLFSPLPASVRHWRP